LIAHDEHFKGLLRTFFREFLEAFLPDLAADLKPGRIELLDKELLESAGRSARPRFVDLVAKVQFRRQAGFVLVHVEHWSSRRSDARRRMFFYAARLMEERRLPVYPVLLTSYDRPLSREPDRYVVEVRGLRVVEFGFRVVQLNRLGWRDYARKPNPAAAALMARMRIAPVDRVKVRLHPLRLLVQLCLDRRKMDLIAGFVSAYLALTGKEHLAFARELDRIEDRREKRKVMELITEWERKGRTEGRTEGRAEGRRQTLREDILDVLEARFDAVPYPLRERIQAVQAEAVLKKLLRQAALVASLAEFNVESER